VLVEEIEAYLREVHARAPGWTARAFARAGSYDLVASAVPPGARVLELGCGDGALLARLRVRGCDPIGIDLSREELAGLERVALARAQALPLRDACVDAVVSHLVLPVIPWPALDPVIAEAARVLRPGGAFVALIGGGPRASRDDAYARFAARAGARARVRAPVMTDPRLRSTRGIAALLADFAEVAQIDHDLELGGSFDEVWAFLAAQYGGATDDDRAALRADFADPHVPCSAHVRLVTAIRR